MLLEASEKNNERLKKMILTFKTIKTKMWGGERAGYAFLCN
jgi:hypothetical protein